MGFFSEALTRELDALADTDGFSTMGDDNAPAIKMKKLTGTTAASEGGNITIPHGLTIGKIIGVQVLVTTSSGNRIPPVFTSVAEHEYDFFVDGDDIRVYLSGTNSGSIKSKAITVLLTYEE